MFAKNTTPKTTLTPNTVTLAHRPKPASSARAAFESVDGTAHRAPVSQPVVADGDVSAAEPKE